PRLGGVEVEADDRTALLHQRQAYQDRARLQEAQQEAAAAVRRASALLALRQQPFGVGLLPHAELGARAARLAEQVAAAAATAEAAEHEMLCYACEGGGPAERALLQAREQSAAQVRQIEAAAAAADRLQQARQAVQDGHARLEELRGRERHIQRELDQLRPWQRTRRRQLQDELEGLRQTQARVREHLAPVRAQGPALETEARAAAEQAPPATVWPLIRRRHADLEREDTQQRAQAELAALQRETLRRADLAPERSADEHAARTEHTERQRHAAQSPTRPAPTARRQRSDAYRPPPSRGHDGPSRGFGR
ncbi:hypothetical protein AB0H81_34060, partial [Nonomuraea sp. NPDC050691]